MNRILASIVAGLNALIAILIILICAAVGWEMATQHNADVAMGAIIGGFVGLLVAALVCGLLALVIDIRNSLRQLVEIARATRTSGGSVESRGEPRFSR